VRGVIEKRVDRHAVKATDAVITPKLTRLGSATVGVVTCVGKSNRSATNAPFRPRLSAEKPVNSLQQFAVGRIEIMLIRGLGANEPD
jgi:hypothetical protein